MEHLSDESLVKAELSVATPRYTQTFTANFSACRKYASMPFRLSNRRLPTEVYPESKHLIGVNDKEFELFLDGIDG